MTYPVRRLRRVHHIGTLDRTHKGCRGASHEGHGLSVSLHPEAWQSIAKLGGFPWWTLTKPDGCFLNIHRLSKKQRGSISAWGVENDLARDSNGWSVTWFDDELDRDCQMVFAGQTQAMDEAESRGAVVKPAPFLVTTNKLRDRIGFVPDPLMVPDFVVLCFANDVLRLDDVWWNDMLDPVGLSAPRGVIFPAILRFWSAKPYENRTA